MKAEVVIKAHLSLTGGGLYNFVRLLMSSGNISQDLPKIDFHSLMFGLPSCKRQTMSDINS